MLFAPPGLLGSLQGPQLAAELMILAGPGQVREALFADSGCFSIPFKYSS